MAKPVHPATVHFPLAFLLLAFGMDILNHLRYSLPAQLRTSLLTPADSARASYYLLSLGLLSAVPAVVTGVREAIVMIAKQGMYEADGKTIKTKVKATIAHAVTNDIVLAVSTYVWYQRRAAIKASLGEKVGAGASAGAYTPDAWMVVAQGLAMGLMLFGANIGGALTYNYGVGFSSASAGGAKKVN